MKTHNMLKLCLFSEKYWIKIFIVLEKVSILSLIQQFNVIVVFECEKIRILKAFLHVFWNLFLGTKKDTTKVKTKAGRYAQDMLKKMPNLSLNMLIDVMLIKKNMYRYRIHLGSIKLVDGNCYFLSSAYSWSANHTGVS